MKRVPLALVTALVAGGSLLAAPASPAEAATRNGTCDAGEFCYYYNSNQAGSDVGPALAEYGSTTPSCFVFMSAGAGQGLCQKNHAASVWNRTSTPVTVYFNSNFGGQSQVIPANTKVNLNGTLKNNNASHRAAAAPAPNPTQPPAPKPTTPPAPPKPAPTHQVAMSWALYKASGGELTCGFDKYRNTPGKHEGIDFARGRGSAIHALVDGVVTYVREGSDATDAIAWVAVYQASTNKTVIYMHLNPEIGVGAKVARGQRIGYEAARGRGPVHTHVEMRPGRQTHASVSSDNVLANPNPTSYWNSQGYRVG